MKGVFVTGTDTGVGKTVVCAWLMRALDGDYWKPVQTGLVDGEDDTQTVRRLTGFAEDRFHAPLHALQAPLSPQAAAKREGVDIMVQNFSLPASPRPVVAEGAGGVLAPLCEGGMMTDLMARLGLPVIVVARTGLGTINHTLLSLEALRARKLKVAGVVFCGEEDAENRSAIETLGEVPVIGEVPILDPLNADSLIALAGDHSPLLDAMGDG